MIMKVNVHGLYCERMFNRANKVKVGFFRVIGTFTVDKINMSTAYSATSLAIFSSTKLTSIIKKKRPSTES